MKATISVDHTDGTIIAETSSAEAVRESAVFLNIALGNRPGRPVDTFELTHPDAMQYGTTEIARFDAIDAIRLDFER